MFITELFEAAQQKTLVIIPGGFHPFHPGHLSLYRSAQKAFPGATIVYAATDDQKERPFAFVDKEKLAAIAGVPERAFQMVKSPFVAREITQNFDPNTTVLIFARSEKDRDEPPRPGGVKKNGEPSYLQPLTKGELAPMSQHGYMAYLPTVQFDAGPSGVTSATQIRTMWPQADDAQKNAIISDLYPRNPAVARQILDKYLGGGLAESNNTITEYRDRLFQYVKSLLPTWPDYILKDWLVPNKGDFSNLPPDALKNGVMEKLKNAGLTTNSKWQLVPSMKFTMDMFEPMSKKRLIGRAGGHSDMGLNVPRDKERHATQAALAQQQGGIRKEPVILIQTPQGYELLEGWHRTIQHFHMYPNGYTGPAYVAVAQSQQDVAEGKNMPDLEHVGERVVSVMDAERRLAHGDRIFAFHEMDEEPFEIHNVGELAGYDTEQLLAVPQSVAEEADEQKSSNVFQSMGSQLIAMGNDADKIKRHDPSVIEKAIDAKLEKINDPKLTHVTKSFLSKVVKFNRSNPKTMAAIFGFTFSIIARVSMQFSHNMGLSPTQATLLIEALLPTLGNFLGYIVNGFSVKDSVQAGLIAGTIGVGGTLAASGALSEDYLDEK